MDNLLFDIPVIDKASQLHRCKECKYIYKHYYGQMKYCKKQYDVRTSYGHKKIKSNDAVCVKFEHK